ncbi:hypothetical protein [Photobacterium leiognathi]|uniref:hypothetical protein n=1 Tax=Photobacterium leiognathi TaxID=553611 RepID=UPI0029820A81|nr:hypothetical protein [Photobacterium leiognathi]
MNKNTENKVASTPLSNFVKNTSQEDKEKIYKDIMITVCDIQNKIIAKAKKIANQSTQ